MKSGIETRSFGKVEGIEGHKKIWTSDVEKMQQVK